MSSRRPRRKSPATNRGAGTGATREPAKIITPVGNVDGESVAEQNDSKIRVKQFPFHLLAVVAFLILGVILVAPPLQGLIAQQEDKRELLSELEEGKERIALLEQELELWNDPTYVQSQARKRLGYVLPGQTLYLVSEEDLGGSQVEKRLQQEAKDLRSATPFYITLWSSVKVIDNLEQGDLPGNVPAITPNQVQKNGKSK